MRCSDLHESRQHPRLLRDDARGAFGEMNEWDPVFASRFKRNWTQASWAGAQSLWQADLSHEFHESRIRPKRVKAVAEQDSRIESLLVGFLQPHQSLASIA